MFIPVMRVVRSVKAHDVVVLIFHPDSAHETAHRRLLFRLNIDNQATYLTQKFAPDERKVVILALKILVNQDHLGKAERQEFHLEELGQVGDEPSSCRVVLKGNIFSSV